MANRQQPMRVLTTRVGAEILAKELTRRRFLNFTIAAAGVGALAACTPTNGKPSPEATGGSLEDTLSLYTWAEYDDPDALAAFTEQHGPQIVISAVNSDQEMISKLVSSRGTSGYDIVVPTGVFIPQMVENGLLAKLNHDLIPNFSNLDPAFTGRDWDQEDEYSVCKNWGSTGFVYDTTKISRELHTWSDFFDAAMTEASGSVSLLDDPQSLCGSYFWSRGEDWTTTDAGQLDACEQFIVDQLAPHISAWDSYPVTAIAEFSHSLIQVWNGEARLGILNSAEPERWQWRLGAPLTEIWMGTWAVLADAPHPEAAHAFINYILEPEVSLKELSYIGFHTGVTGIEEAAAAEGLPMLDLIFFQPAEIDRMRTGVVNDATTRFTEIYSKAQAAAGSF